MGFSIFIYQNVHWLLPLVDNIHASLSCTRVKWKVGAKQKSTLIFEIKHSCLSNFNLPTLLDTVCWSLPNIEIGTIPQKKYSFSQLYPCSNYFENTCKLVQEMHLFELVQFEKTAQGKSNLNESASSIKQNYSGNIRDEPSMKFAVWQLLRKTVYLYATKASELCSWFRIFNVRSTWRYWWI